MPPAAAAASGAAVLSNTSSTKRHHGAAADSTRAAKMDALLLELEAEKERVAHRPDARRAGGRTEQQQHSRNRGSHVDEGDELITTNIFVGNLAPSITEEQMTDLFRQFGEHNDTAVTDGIFLSSLVYDSERGSCGMLLNHHTILCCE